MIRDSKSKIYLLMKALRIHQWVKNLLLFVPILTSYEWIHPSKLFVVFIGFIAFSLGASSIYLVNDLVDLEADRGHFRKKNRPFASGDLPLAYGVGLFPVMLLGCLATALLLPVQFSSIILIYLCISVSYSFALKKILLVDVVCLAALYTIRIFAGSTATGIPISRWLLTFSLFLFFGLAMLKRFTELRKSKTTNKIKIHGRGYFRSDRSSVFVIGIATSFLSVLVFALYVSSAEVSTLYSKPDWLWLIIPILLYWNSRVWMLTFRGVVHDDPIVFALKDRVSYLSGLLTLVCIYFAK